MKKIQIKPISVNDAWKGRRFKTDAYKAFEKEALLKLPRLRMDMDIELKLRLIFYVSSRAFDIDNGVKPFLDVLQKRYGFNDNKIYYLSIAKQIVPKGMEKIEFKFETN